MTGNSAQGLAALAAFGTSRLADTHTAAGSFRGFYPNVRHHAVAHARHAMPALMTLHPPALPLALLPVTVLQVTSGSEGAVYAPSSCHRIGDRLLDRK